MSKNPSIGSVPGDVAPGLRSFLTAVKEAIEVRNGQRGDALDTGVTLRMLQNVDGITVKVPGGGGGLPGIGIDPGKLGDQTPPPAVANLQAAGGLASILLTWDLPTYPNHAYTEIWRAQVDNLGQASKVGMTPGKVYADSVGGGRTFYYWARAVSRANVMGPYNAVAGVFGETSRDPAYVMDILTGDSTTPFVIQAEPTIINGYPVPAGTYIRDAFIKVGTISRAMIGLAVIDDARIADLSAEKITAGYLDAARIKAGTITGDMIAANTITASNLVAGTINAELLAAGAVKADNIAAGAVTADKVSVTSLSAISANIGAITAAQISIQDDGSGGYGYVRSSGKGWNDGINGWALARKGDGSAYVDFKGGNSRIWASSWGDSGISFPNFSVDSSGNVYCRGDIQANSLTANSVNTPNMVDRAVSDLAFAGGTLTSGQQLPFSVSYSCLVIFGSGGAIGNLGLFRSDGSLVVSSRGGSEGGLDPPRSCCCAALIAPGSYYVQVLAGPGGGTTENTFAVTFKR